MAVPFLLCGVGLLFAMCAACFYRMGAADWADEKKFLIDSLESLELQNTKLRELVHWMYDRMDESCAVQHPYAPTPISYDRLMQAQARARELGVEVEVE